jgi:endonuclease YncB( thermonuclease family)
MKKLFLLFAILLPLAARAIPARVDYILDGDTFAAGVMLDDDIEITVRVRIIDIDAPEMSGACDAEINMAAAARDRLTELLPIGAIVELSNVKDDKYLGRIDANVMTLGGGNISKILVAENHARPYNGGKRQQWCE